MRDVDQGAAGTCVILASLSAVAASGVNLADRITPLGGDRYEVPLYRPGTGWVTQTVTFDGTWTANDPAPRGPGDFWVLLYQRAYLQEMGVNWADPDAARWAERYGGRFQGVTQGLLALTGSADLHSAPVGGLTGRDYLALRRALAAGRPAICATGLAVPAAGGQPALVADHAYTVLGIRSDAAGTRVRVRNPWGVDGPNVASGTDGAFDLPWATFSRAMTSYCLA